MVLGYDSRVSTIIRRNRKAAFISFLWRIHRTHGLAYVPSAGTRLVKRIRLVCHFCQDYWRRRKILQGRTDGAEDNFMEETALYRKIHGHSTIYLSKFLLPPKEYATPAPRNSNLNPAMFLIVQLPRTKASLRMFTVIISRRHNVPQRCNFFQGLSHRPRLMLRRYRVFWIRAL